MQVQLYLPSHSISTLADITISYDITTRDIKITNESSPRAPSLKNNSTLVRFQGRIVYR